MLALAASRFDVLITVDKNLPYQQNTHNLPVSVVVMDALSKLLPIVPVLERALLTLAPCSDTVLRAEPA